MARHMIYQELVYQPIRERRRDFKLTSRRYRRVKPPAPQAPQPEGLP